MTPEVERIRFAVRVKPRSQVDRVGGSWGEKSILLVAVQAAAGVEAQLDGLRST